MRLTFRILVLLLLTLFGSATLHCRIANLLDSEASVAKQHCHALPDDGCTRDHCDVLEQGLFSGSSDSVKIDAPAFSFCDCLLCVVALTRGWELEELPPAKAEDGPSNWVPLWNFDRRAASVPRAPSCAKV